MHRHDTAPPLLMGFLVAVTVIVIQMAVVSTASAGEVVDGDIIVPQPYAPAEIFDAPRIQTLNAGDPLNLVQYPNELRRYSLGRDVFEVWECPDAGPLSTTAAQFAAEAETRMSPFFLRLSGGRYDPDFIAAGAVPVGSDCASWARTHSTGVANGALFIRETSGGLAGPGTWCLNSPYTCPTTYPANYREGYIGVAGLPWTTLAHEIGHMLSWPHSSAGASSYDNAIDLMSGNYGMWSSGGVTRWGTYPDPYSTVGINLYGAGWFDPNDVVMWDGTDSVATITSTVGTGDQMLIIDTGGSYFTFDLRVSQQLDPIPTAWTGVEVYEITRCSDCWGLSAKVRPTPPVPFNFSDLGAYSRPLPHVLTPGSSISIGTATITLLQRNGGVATLQITSSASSVPLPLPLPPPPPPPPPHHHHHHHRRHGSSTSPQPTPSSPTSSGWRTWVSPRDATPRQATPGSAPMVP